MIKIADFKVLQRITVSDLEIKPKQVSANYTVTHLDGEQVSTRLIYSYQSPIFNKKNSFDINLASIMVAQVSLNYGLFADELIFDGLFMDADKRFIIDMTENTSREILTNKLLVPNEFLLSPYNELVPEKLEKYTQANILFNNTQFTGIELSKTKLYTNKNKYAILSSGGKDSLLSYGLINEFGEAHPIFVNEAGRHWFTAVNAYKYFDEHESNTAKVWCNSDRVFNWMLKQLPFIRRDYANVRADIYPIRLWTVAVFLFGVLPIALQRKIGNIIIGDEFDTTETKNLNGIQHYSGLYDQSKYFDNALTRYFQRKQWEIFQYSLLRSLSEILIMKLLLKRYPHLQKHQISCHAAHEREKRMYPCGNCEKCRRIIGMITALGENPISCGYTEEQIKRALHLLPLKKVKQIGSDAAHMYYLLLENGWLKQNESTLKLAKKHSQVMALRFDRERSNLEDMPGHIRKELFKILSEYSEGAMELIDKKWKTIKLDSDYISIKKYKFNES